MAPTEKPYRRTEPMETVYIKGRGYVIKADPWIEDGNLIIITEFFPTAFRVHRGVLARHSEVFDDMLKMPQPSQGIESFEECQIVSIYDPPLELSNLLRALYDGPNFSNSSPDGFFTLAGILRLATKYFISHLRRQAIDFLGQTWGVTLEGHDHIIETALSSPRVNDCTYPYVHPIHLLNLARQVDAPVLLPSAFYFLSLYTLSDILKADHPKVLTDHISKPESLPTPTDIMKYTLMYQQRLQYMETFLHTFCAERVANPLCREEQSCGKGFARLLSSLHRSWNIRTGVLHFILQTIRKVSSDRSLCAICRSNFEREASIFRQNMWDELPRIVGLSPWEAMLAA